MLTATNKTHEVTYDSLRSIPAPVSMGPRHRPIEHIRLVDSLIDVAFEHVPTFQYERDLKLYMNPDSQSGLDFSLCLNHAKEGDNSLLNTSRYIVGGHDNSQRKSVYLSAASEVWVCSNGMVAMSGGQQTRRKHTARFDLRRWIEDQFEICAESSRLLDARVIRLDSIQVDEAHENELVGELFRSRLLSPKVLRRALSDDPDCSKEETALGFYNRLNVGCKLLPTHAQPMALHNALAYVWNTLGVQAGSWDKKMPILN